MSQSAVSQSIRQLEEFVQAPLLDRSSRPMAMTQEGEVLHRTSTEVLGRLAYTVEDLRKTGRSDNDAVTISCNLGFATYWLMPRLNFFSASFPDVAVNVMAAYQGDADFQSGADVAIRYGEGNWGDGDWQLLYNETIVPICSPEYRERTETIATSDILAGRRLIHVAKIDPNWLSWEKYFKYIGCAEPLASGGLRFGNYVQAVQAALMGDGIMLGWRAVVGDLLKAQQLTVAFDHPVALESGFYFSKAQGLNEKPGIHEFIEWLQQQAAETPNFG